MHGVVCVYELYCCVALCALVSVCNLYVCVCNLCMCACVSCVCVCVCVCV